MKEHRLPTLESFAERHPHLATVMLPALFGLALLQTRLLQTRVVLWPETRIEDLTTVEVGQYQEATYDKEAAEVIVPDGGVATVLVEDVSIKIDDYKMGKREEGAKVTVGKVKTIVGPAGRAKFMIGNTPATLIHVPYGTHNELQGRKT